MQYSNNLTSTIKTSGDKPGWKSTEFLMAVIVALVNAIIASGLVVEGTVWAQIAGVVIMMLTAAGYSVIRPIAKAGAGADYKPGWRTSEFWFTLLATAIGLVTASGIQLEGTPVGLIVGMITTLLTAMGYTTGRAIAKAGPKLLPGK